ncbi:MAG TPA: GNAT family N-acetyltransferase [Pyrinomonadaceae bacterium]|nr:GNAT family N-acetyltransferase [Pyrinomonadaceae bacterium]
MMLCHLADPTTSGADTRMAAYFEGRHHPQDALASRVGYVASIDQVIVGYIAGHRTTRHGCAGEVQYLFVSPEFRRRGIATGLLRLLAEWFQSEGVREVCVALANDSPPEAKPFYESVGATPLKKHWYSWKDIAHVLR